MEFKYKIEAKGSIGDTQEDFFAARNPETNEIIKIQNDENGQLGILANKDGWLFFFFFCVEMAFSAEINPEYHLHRTNEFMQSFDSSKDAIGLFIIDNSSAKF